MQLSAMKLFSITLNHPNKNENVVLVIGGDNAEDAVEILSLRYPEYKTYILEKIEPLEMR